MHPEIMQLPSSQALAAPAQSVLGQSWYVMQPKEKGIISRKMSHLFII